MSGCTNYFIVKDMLESKKEGRPMRFNHYIVSREVMWQQIRDGEAFVMTRERLESIMRDLEQFVP